MLAQQPPACWGSDLRDKDTPTASPVVIGTGQPAPSPALGAQRHKLDCIKALAEPFCGLIISVTVAAQVINMSYFLFAQFPIQPVFP